MNILFQPHFEKPVLDGTKIHTIRTNYDYWKQMADGKECSFRVWTGRPYRSPQREFCRSRIGVQPLLVFCSRRLVSRSSLRWYALAAFENKWHRCVDEYLAKNDGFCKKREFQEWFRDIKAGTHHFAILHRADFRY